MSRRPWMPFYVGDYIADTRHLSTVQNGAYLLLIMSYWARGGLPDDDVQLANITRLDVRTWRKHRPTLQKFFHDGWKHKRIDFELAKHAEIAAKRAIAGQRGAMANILRFPPKPPRR